MSKVICLDLEMNQPSGKIIQIGYVIADVVTNRTFLERSIVVDPKEPLGEIVQGDLQVPVAAFTGISQERIDQEGVSLLEAYQILCDDVKRHNPTTTCVQWGDGAGDHKGDHDAIRRELGLDWDSFIFRPRSWDVKSLYQIYRAFHHAGVVGGVNSALKSLGMTFEGREHDALCDAKNTYRIFYLLGQKLVLADQLKRLVNK